MGVDLSTLPLVQIGWGSIVTLVILLIIRGDLIPRKMHAEIVADRDRWRSIAEQLTQQNSQLIGSTRLSVVAMQEIADRAAMIRDEEDGAS